jgi:hypothetical protein
MSEFEIIQKAYQCKTKEEGLNYYTYMIKQHAATMSLQQIKMECVSLINRNQRQSLKLDQSLKIGDVCYIDYGPMYRYEAGYQHFGIILKLSHYKAFVVPLTSNTQPHHIDKDHVFKLGPIQGLTKHSICFLNDAKFINTSRIIDVYGHLSMSDERFLQLRRKVFETIFG